MPLDTVRGRLMTLLAIATVPLLTMAAVVAWQSYDAASDQARQIVLVAREAAVARHEAAVTSASHLVTALAASPRIWTDRPEQCSAFLTEVAALSPDRYDMVVAISPDGAVRCGSGNRGMDRSFAGAGWFARLRASGKTVGGALSAGSRDAEPSLIGDAVVVASPVGAGQEEGRRFAGALAVFLRLDWLTHAAEVLPLHDPQATQSWLIGPGAQAFPVGGASVADLPELVTLHGLLQPDAGSGARLARSAGGERFAYAVADLSDSLRLLSGFRAGELIGPARDVLLTRFAVLGLVMILGMGIVAAGANRALADPVKRLTKAVRTWRADAPGGVFDAGPSRHMPAEIAELALAFAETTSALSAQEAQLRAATGHQDLLMKEIHHRVKNNLQIVASLLNLQSNRIALPAARAEFQSARDRVRALATLHRHLYSEGELHTINMRGFLTELCGQLFQAMGESEGDRIRLDIEAPELAMSSDQATPLSLIVTEAVSNSLKYAFPGGRRGVISVVLTSDGESATLTIQDDGVGIPAGKAETDTGTRDGLGLQLMAGFARQLGAELHVERAPDGRPGTRYGVTMALHPQSEGVS